MRYETHNQLPTELLSDIFSCKFILDVLELETRLATFHQAYISHHSFHKILHQAPLIFGA